MSLLTRLFPHFILQFAERLRFPQLFLLTLGLFVFDVLLPDFIPFVDEILLALATLILAALRKRGDAPAHGRNDRAAPIAGKGVRVD